MPFSCVLLHTRVRLAFRGHVTHAVNVLWTLSFGRMFQFSQEAWADSGCHGENERSSPQRRGPIDFNLNWGHSANGRSGRRVRRITCSVTVSLSHQQRKRISPQVTTFRGFHPRWLGRTKIYVPSGAVRNRCGNKADAESIHCWTKAEPRGSVCWVLVDSFG